MSKWEKVKLKNMALRKLEYGSGAAATEYDGQTRYIRITDINDLGKLGNDPVSPSTVDEKYKLDEGDILFARSGATVGKTFLYHEDNGYCIYAGYLIRFVPNKEIANPKYVYYYTKAPIYKAFIESNSRVVAQPNINAQQYGELEIPLPPLDTQKQIAKTLDTAAELLAMRKQQFAELDNLIKSTFYDMFGDPLSNEMGWEIRKIIDIAKVETGSTPNRNNVTYYYKGLVPWVKTGEISNGYIVRTEEMITAIAIIETNCKVFPCDTILVAMYGQGKTRGQACMLKIDAATNQACAAILPNKQYISEFLYRILEIQYEDLRKLGRGGNQQNLNLSIIKNFEIIVPPLPLQTKFANIVTKIEEQKDLVKKAIEETQFLFDSLMNEYFK